MKPIAHTAIHLAHLPCLHETWGKGYGHKHADAILCTLSNKTIASDPKVSGLLPASMKLRQASLLAMPIGKISDPSQFLTCKCTHNNIPQT